MIGNKRILAVIPARGGSKGVRRKNIREINGKPLVVYSIEAAKASSYLDKVVVSSEDEEILSICEKWGSETITRPVELAGDNTPGVNVVLHALQIYNDYDYVVLLQPTSPLRRSKDIDGAIEFCVNSSASFCVSVCESDKNPYWMFTKNSDNSLSKIVPGKIPGRRQDIPKIYILNGAIYVTEVTWIKTNKAYNYEDAIAYEIPVEYSIDIDTEQDFSFLEFQFQHKNHLHY